jgi:hypothetical protein
MKTIKTPNFFILMISLVLGRALFNQFNVEQMQFENNALAAIYSITFVLSVYFLVTDWRKTPKK